VVKYKKNTYELINNINLKMQKKNSEEEVMYMLS